MSARKQYEGAAKVLHLYWATYGGLGALLRSPFFHAAAVCTLLCVPLWWTGAWWERSISIIPSVLGFSIAAFTLLLGIGDEGFRRRLATKRKAERPSTLTNTSSGIFHFIVVQVVALVYALFASGKPLTFIVDTFDLAIPSGFFGLVLLCLAKVFRAFGFFFLCYALFTAVAATMSIFRLADLFSKFASTPPPVAAGGAQGQQAGAAASTDHRGTPPATNKAEKDV